ncbi:MAG: hypothetical protein JWM53_4190 [bacterium]|nr:hypothetical protein [bacterium]
MRRWLTSTVLLTAAVAGVAVGANVAADLYGLYRDPAGRALPVYGDERVAKYLLSTRYVQSNFDGALIGSSISANWPVVRMAHARLYNESLNGGNIVEEKAILERLLDGGRTRGVILVVHPYLTASHEFNSVQLAPRLEWGALGSENLFEAYKRRLKIHLGRDKLMFDAAGTADFDDKAKKLNVHLEAMMQPGSDFEIDPLARAAYRDVVLALHAHQIPIAFVVPPVSDVMRARKGDAFARYAAEILRDRAPADLVLDFTSDELGAIGHDAANFTDGVHLRAAAAAHLVATIDEHLADWRR